MGPTDRRRPAPGWVAALLLLLSGSLMLLRQASYGLLGFDSYAILISSRVRGWSDLIGNLTERLMDGRYPGAFYRPLLNLSFALDEALWGIEPFGYQLTNVLWYGLCGWALWFLVRRMLPSAPYAASVSLLVYLTLPIHVEVVPVPARRPELLCGAFMLLALAVLLEPGRLERRTGSVRAGLCAALAVAGKDTGLVLPVLVFALVLLWSPARLPSERFRHAARAAAEPMAAVIVLLMARVAVLGGLGGHGWESFAPGSMAIGLGHLVLGFLYPQQGMLSSFPLNTLPILLVGGSLAALLFSRGARIAGLAPTMTFGAVWMVVLGALSVSGGLAVWHRWLPTLGWCLLVAGLFTWLGASSSPIVARGGPLLLGLVVAWHAVHSPLVHRYTEWDRASRASAEFLRQAEALVRSNPDGVAVVAPPLPFWVEPASEGPTVAGAHVLTGSSLQAWAELAIPDRRVRVESAHTRPARPASDEIVLVVVGRRAGFDPRPR